MREIQFRAWDKYMKRLSYVREIKFQGGKILKARLGVDSVLDGKNIELMQNTGLKDKNGVDIYEGDILEIYGVVEFGYIDGSYDGDYGIGFNVNPFADDLKIIGNIYENPELL